MFESNNFNEFDDEVRSNILDPRVLSPLYIARSKRNGDGQGNVQFKQITEGKDIAPYKDNFVDYEGYRFPANLNAPWAISKVLIQKKGKLSVKDLKSSAKTSIKISAQAKEQIFLQKVTELEDEERRNQLKWQVKLGETSIDDEAREDILKSRARAEYEYKLSMGVPFLDIETNRQTNLAVECRPVRPVDKVSYFNA